ncbi:hypothetical protein MRBLWO14_002468 [Microbacterium sp. LWO14-1.2]|uniref:hypothetical protein n=1 Tax=unclassified Microbacterium TaxID=2609290 RepID=UPI003139877F
MAATGNAKKQTTSHTRRKKTTFGERRSIRFSEEEERSVQDLREAIAVRSGRAFEDVTFSEAVRLLVRDKKSAAEIEARALAIQRGGGNASEWGLWAISERLGYELAPMRRYIARIGGDLNRIAGRLAKEEKIPYEELADALQAAADLRHVPDDIERRIAHLVQRGLPERGVK